MLADKPLRDVLSAFAASRPTPGGGSASALASALGASVLMMVARVPKTRSDAEADRVALAGAAAALSDHQQRLIEAIDADSDAYDAVVAAYKLPHTNDTERSARRAAIDRALRAATEVPLDVMRLSVLATEQAQVVARHGYDQAASDVGVAIGLLRAGLTGARLNVDANLHSLSDASYAMAVGTIVKDLNVEGTKSADAADVMLGNQ